MAKPDRKPDPDFEPEYDVADPDYDETSQDASYEVSDPDSQDASQEWYARKQK